MEPRQLVTAGVPPFCAISDQIQKQGRDAAAKADGFYALLRPSQNGGNGFTLQPCHPSGGFVD